MKKSIRVYLFPEKTERSFRSCEHPDQDIWTIDHGKLDELYKTMVQNSLTFPYEYAYTEIKGAMTAPSKEIKSKGYDSVLTVNEILTFEQKNFRNTCIPYEFWAIGNEPNWSLQVSKKEDLIALKDYSTEEVYLFPYFEPKVVNDELFTYRTENTATSSSLEAVIKKQKCGDGMSSKDYNYSAQVILNGKVLRGCAIKGDLLPF